jgi:predicted aldo/keto reductase-like oxidoreductase
MTKEYVGKTIPKLGFGLMRLPTLAGGSDKDVDLEKVKEMVDLFMARGFTYFDTAYVYHGGESEVVAREAIVKRYPRDKFQLTTKMPLWDVKSIDDYEKIFKTQLERAGVDYFDVYLLHGIGGNSLDKIDETGGWDFLKLVKERGQAKHIGFSFHSPASDLEKILSAHPEVEVVQLQINYVDWESDDVQARLCYETAMKYNKSVIVMEPIRGGSLAVMSPDTQKIFTDYRPDVSVASWALRFCASLDNIVTILSGMTTLEQVSDNTETMMNAKPLSDEERQVIGKVIKALNEVPTVPCTGCKYCINDCPQKIMIPAIIESLNEYKKFRSLPNIKRRYDMITGRGGKASSCIDCKSCEEHCPQHIKITEVLREAAELFE